MRRPSEAGRTNHAGPPAGGGSAPVALSPADSLDLAVDLYWIDIYDRVVLTGNFTGPQITLLLRPFGANRARFFTNAIDTRTTGVDVTAAWRVPAPALGSLRLLAGYNHNLTHIVGERPTPPPLAGLAQVLFDRIDRRRVECGQPRDSARGSAEWRGANREQYENVLRIARQSRQWVQSALDITCPTGIGVL